MHGATGAGTNLIVAAFNATFGIKRKSKNEDDECVKDRPALNDDNTEVAAKNNRVCKKYEEDAYISNDERKKNGVKRRRQEGTGNNTVVNITPLPNHDDDDDNDNVTTYLLRIAVEAQKPLDHLKEQLSKRLKGACLGLLTTSKLRIESRIVPNRGGVTFKDRKEQEEEEEWEGEDKSSELKRG
eukprot:jgi/Bigna1/146030/aug1.107_g20738